MMGSDKSLAHFQQLKLIGDGGMGKVYSAFDSRLHRTVALKQIRSELIQENRENILLEAQSLAKVNNLNVMQVYSIIEQASDVFLVGERIQGETLAVIQREKLLSLENKLSILRDISEGMQAVHNAKLVHGDLKASNVIITESGNVKIIDFGLAHHLNQPQNLAKRFASVGTITPELLKQRPVKAESDLFSFGVLAYELIAGYSPFGKSSFEEVCAKITKGEHSDASLIYPSIPHPVVLLLNQLLQKDPENRPQSFKVVAQQLDKVLKGLILESLKDDDTVEITEKLNSSKKRLVYPLVGIVVVVAALFMWLGQVQQPIQYVAVVKPVVIDEEFFTSKQRESIVTALDFGVRQAVLEHPELHLVPRYEQSEEGVDIQSVFQKTSAHHVITPNLQCKQGHCEITLALYQRATSNTAKTVSWVMQTYSLRSTLLETQSKLANLFPESSHYFSDTAAINSELSEEDYATFLHLYKSVHFQGDESQETLNKLQLLVQRSPHLYPVYSLFRQVSLNMYRSSNESTYLKQLHQILSMAPPNYRKHQQFTIDELWIALYAKETGRAEMLLQEAKDKGVDQLTLNELQATYYLSNGQYEQAVEYYKRGLALRFSSHNLFNLAVSYWYLGDYLQASESLKELLVVIPDEYSALQMLASVFLISGDLDKAIPAFEQLTANNAQSMDLNNLAISYSLNRDFVLAKTAALRAVKMSPNQPAWLLNLADIELYLGNELKATEIYQNILKIVVEKEDLESVLLRAQSWLHLGDPQQAIKAVNKANRMAPDSGEVAFASALVYSKLGEYNSAIAKVEVALDAGVGAAWFNLPWFDSLCENKTYLSLFAENVKVCTQ